MPRYTMIRERWQNHIGIKFLFVFELKALLAVVLSIPFALLAMDPLQRITGYEWLGLSLWVIAFWGEYVADSQLKHFKADPENQGLVCQEGLWYHSRHPNYFFEWMIWVAYFVSALATSYGAWTIICPMLMLFLLLRATGIPMTEKHALQSRGEEYAENQRTTSRFIPWTKKSAEKSLLISGCCLELIGITIRLMWTHEDIQEKNRNNSSFNDARGIFVSGRYPNPRSDKNRVMQTDYPGL